MAGRQIPDGRVLTGRAVRLETANAARHGRALFDAAHGSEATRAIWDYLPDGPFQDADDLKAWIEPPCAQPNRLPYTIVDGATDTPLGMAQYLDIDTALGSIEIGYIWFAPALQRTRGSTEALYLLLAHAFDDLDYRRMQWKTNAFNEKSRRAARRLGFRFEGIFYNHRIDKGRNRDTAWYSILDTEWPDVKERIAAWLADSNFDGGGRAQSSLMAVMARRNGGD